MRKPVLNARYFVLSTLSSLLVAMGFIAGFAPDLLTEFSVPMVEKLIASWEALAGAGLVLGGLNAYLSFFKGKSAAEQRWGDSA